MDSVLLQTQGQDTNSLHGSSRSSVEEVCDKLDALSVNQSRKPLSASQSLEVPSENIKQVFSKAKNSCSVVEETSNFDADVLQEFQNQLNARLGTERKNQSLKTGASESACLERKESGDKPNLYSNERERNSEPQEDSDDTEDQTTSGHGHLIPLGPHGAKAAVFKPPSYVPPSNHLKLELGGKRCLDEDFLPTAYRRTEPDCTLSKQQTGQVMLNSQWGRSNEGLSCDPSTKQALKQKLVERRTCTEVQDELGLIDEYINREQQQGGMTGGVAASAALNLGQDSTSVLAAPQIPNSSVTNTVVFFPFIVNTTATASNASAANVLGGTTAQAGYKPILPRPPQQPNIPVPVQTGKEKMAEIIRKKRPPTNVSKDSATAILFINSIPDKCFHSQDQRGNTLVMQFVLTDQYTYLKLTLERLKREQKVANYINQPNKQGKTPLFAAVEAVKPELVRLLLQYSADPNLAAYLDGVGLAQPLHQAATCPTGIHVLELLLTVPSLALECIDTQGNTALMHATMAHQLHGSEKLDNSAIIRMLLEKGADPTKINMEKKTNIMYAVESGDATILQYIIEKMKGRDVATLVNKSDSAGNTALHIAVTLGGVALQTQLQIIEVLRAHGADTNKLNKNGLPAFKMSQFPEVRLAAGGQVSQMLNPSYCLPQQCGNQIRHFSNPSGYFSSHPAQSCQPISSVRVQGVLAHTQQVGIPQLQTKASQQMPLQNVNTQQIPYEMSQYSELPKAAPYVSLCSPAQYVDTPATHLVSSPPEFQLVKSPQMAEYNHPTAAVQQTQIQFSGAEQIPPEVSQAGTQLEQAYSPLGSETTLSPGSAASPQIPVDLLNGDIGEVPLYNPHIQLPLKNTYQDPMLSTTSSSLVIQSVPAMADALQDLSCILEDPILLNELGSQDFTDDVINELPSNFSPEQGYT